VEAPTAGPLPTPSNFEGAIAARAAQAEANGGLYQPTAGAVPPERGANWREPSTGTPEGARLGDFNADDARSVAGGDPQQQQGEDQLSQVEPQYDADGNPIDPQTDPAAQRAQLMDQIAGALESGELPYEALKGLMIEVSVNGEQRKVSLEEARGGYMRRAHFTRELEKAQGMAQQAQSLLQLERARNQEWRNPAALRQGMRTLGLEQAFGEAAMEWAKERVQYLQKSPQERALIDERNQFMSEREQWQAEQRRLQLQQQQNPQADPQTQAVMQQLQQVMPQVFRKHGIGNYPLAQQNWLQQLQAFCPDGQITPERCEDAAIATTEWLADMDRIRREQEGAGGPAVSGQQPSAAFQGHQQAAGGQQGYPLNPRRLAGAPNRPLTLGNVLHQPGGPQAPRPNGQQARRPSDFVRRMGLG
jgi:hypothetical protein